MTLAGREVRKGAEVTLRVTSDEANELHLNRDNQYADIRPGVTANLVLTADSTGVFAVELHRQKRKVMSAAVR